MLHFIIFLTVLIVGCEDQKEIDNKIIMSDDFQIAQDSYFKGNYSLSIKLYSKLIKRHPDVVWLYKNRGDSYSDNGNVLEAIKDYEFVIQNNGKDKVQAMLKSGLTFFM